MTGESLSMQLIRTLRSEADKSSRPKERNGTIDRLEEACNGIANGTARAIIRDGLPRAEIYFRRSPVRIAPPRIEEYVLARRALDINAGRIGSPWTGPTATTIRKDSKLLEYVRTRDQENAAKSGRFVPKSAEKLLDDVPDIALRSELRMVLARGRQAESDLMRLKEGMRLLRPTVDIDLLTTHGGSFAEEANMSFLSLSNGVSTDEAGRQILSVAKKLTDTTTLSRFGLELHQVFGNVIEKKTRSELLSSEETKILLLLAKRA